MKSSELRQIEEQRLAERNVVVRRVARSKRKGGWDESRLRSEVENEFRQHGGKVFREERES